MGHSEASAGAAQGDSEESETEVTSPESRRKPTRRGGRRARHRKQAALLRQAAVAEQAEQAEQAQAEGSSPPAGTSASSRSPEAGDRSVPARALEVSQLSSSSLGVAEVDGVHLIGSTVLIQGLIRSPEFNGQWGYVESYDPQMQRYLVSVVLPTQLPGEAPLYAKLRRDNLVLPCPDLPQVPNAAASEVPGWPAEPAFIQEPALVPFFPGAMQAPLGPAADFEDSVGAAMASPSARIEPGHSLDSGSPGTSPPQDQLSPPMTLTSPEMLGINRHLWLNQSAADFEDSIAGQLVLESPKAASGAASPFSRAKYGLGYAEGTAADFEDSIGGTMTGLPDFFGSRSTAPSVGEDAIREPDRSSSLGKGWQPSLRPKGS